MTDDIVEDLRGALRRQSGGRFWQTYFLKAADEIERLREAIEDACRLIVDDDSYQVHDHASEIFAQAYKGRSDYDDMIGRLEWLVTLVVNWADARDAANRGEERDEDDVLSAEKYAQVKEVELRKAVSR